MRRKNSDTEFDVQQKLITEAKNEYIYNKDAHYQTLKKLGLSITTSNLIITREDYDNDKIKDLYVRSLGKTPVYLKRMF